MRGEGPATLVDGPYLNAAVEVTCYEHAIRLSAPQKEASAPPPPTREKGDIKTFSRHSRSRLVQKLLKLRSSRLSEGLFVTLTYHHNWSQDHEDVQRHLGAFLAAYRRAYPEAAYIWRLEFQNRGAPHFHFICWRRRSAGEFDRDAFQEWCVRTWHRISGESSEAHRKHGVDVRTVDSHRAAMAYVSKYVAKVGGEKAVDYEGRRWGASRSLPTGPVARAACTEDFFHVLRRICRKLLQKRRGGSERYAEHLRQGRTMLISIDESQGARLLQYLMSQYPNQARAGPPDIPDRPGRERHLRYARALGEARRHGQPRWMVKPPASTNPK